MINLKPRSMRLIQFTIPGKPNQKRSAKPWAIPAIAKDGSAFHRGVAAANPKNKPVEQNIQQWVEYAGWKPGTPVHEAGVMLEVRCFFPVRKSDPAWMRPLYETEEILHTAMPDLDRLENMVQDALSGVVWKDDRQVARRAGNSGKWWSYNPRTEVRIWLIKDQMPQSKKEYVALCREMECGNDGE